MKYSQVLEKAGCGWLLLQQEGQIYYMEYDVSDTETPEEQENDLVYNFDVYKAVNNGAEEYDGGLLELNSAMFTTPQAIKSYLAEGAFWPRKLEKIEEIDEPEWAD